MEFLTFFRRMLLLTAGTMLFLSQVTAAELPANIAGNLRRLISANTKAPVANLNTARLVLNTKTNKYELLSGKPNFVADASNRVLVRIVLNGTVSLSSAAETVQKAGGKVVATSAFARGLLNAFIPLSSAATLAGAPGIQSIHLSSRPLHKVGAVTSQGVDALHADNVLSQGITGKGVTAGILSDSFNTSGSSDTAASDVATGDLPNTTAIPGGEGLKALLADFPDGTDEGRAMAQIVHDMAPGAALCFATAANGEVSFANYILALADDNGPCNADIVMDDAYYFAEPFFSDGVVTDAINTVSTRQKKDGSRVAYFTAAGNQQDDTYDSAFHPVSLKTAAAEVNSYVNLSTLPSSIDVGGGLQNFGDKGDVVVAQELIVVGDPVLVLQWNDPFDVGKITASYDLLLFDQNGNYIQASDVDNNASSDDNAFLTDEPVQGIAFDTTATNGVGLYYLVIARSSEGVGDAKRIKWIAAGDGYVVAPYTANNVPTVFGHSGATNAISVAAYEVNRAPFSPDPPYFPELEYFTSPGPFFNYFDQNSNRLPEPEVRQKPDVACVDGVFTTFFGQYILASDAFPRFYGTSAATPCAAGIGALMLDKAESGRHPYHPEPWQLLQALRDSVENHDSNPFEVADQADLGGGSALTISVVGNNNDIGDPDNFHVSLAGAGGWSLTALHLNIPAKDDVLFFQAASYPFSPGTASPGVTVSLLNLVPPAGETFMQDTKLDLAFTGLRSGKFADFNVDRAEPEFGYIDDDADRLENTTYKAELADKEGHKLVVTGALKNNYSNNWNPFDGYGLINADVAVANIN